MLLYNLGVLLDDMERKREAMDAYEAALRGDPGLADCHYNLALLYEELEQPKEAIRHMAQYRRLIGGQIGVRRGLRDWRHRTGVLGRFRDRWR